MKMTGKKKLVGTFLIVGTLAICLILVLNRGGTPKVDRYEAIDGDTIKAQFSDGSSILIRYAAVNTPARSQTLGTTAWEFNEGLIQSAQAAGNLVVDLKPTDEGNNGKDRDGRPLAHVFVGGERSAEGNVEVRLVAKGYARLDIRNPCDKDIANGQDFDVRYAEDLIAAQIEAAMARRGWWGEDDEYADSDLIIAAIKQWSDDEIVYIINRGSEPVNLTDGWRLEDYAEQQLFFSNFPDCVLPPGGLLRVHSHSAAKEKKGTLKYRTDTEIDLYWRGDPIWNQDEDIGILYEPNNASEVYFYTYPLTTDYWR